MVTAGPRRRQNPRLRELLGRGISRYSAMMDQLKYGFRVAVSLDTVGYALRRLALEGSTCDSDVIVAFRISASGSIVVAGTKRLRIALIIKKNQ
jgi:hypothetical protein